MNENVYKSLLLEECDLLFGGAVKVLFPDDSPMGKLIVTRGRNQGVVSINLIDLCAQPEPPEYVIRPGHILISATRRNNPPESRLASDEELRASIRLALVTFVMPGETHWMLRDKADAKQSNERNP